MSLHVPDFIGLDTHYPLASGGRSRLVHLDAAASPLPLRASQASVQRFLPHYANTHSTAHLSARISTSAIEWAYRKILEFLGATASRHAIIATGTGATLPINRIARGLSALRPERDVVLVSAMEHHANDLPHRYYGGKVRFIPLLGSEVNSGPVDTAELKNLLERYRGRVNYIAVSGVSNVTGIVNPIYEIARIAHENDTLVLVDGAQMVAHMTVSLDRPDPIEDPDFFVFSGHKVYTPGAPGILVANKLLLHSLPQPDLGGGMVKEVSFDDYQVLPDFPDREQAGTPNIVGLIALASSLDTLSRLGMEAVSAHTRDLTAYLIGRLGELSFINVYGAPDVDRVGATAFNINGVDHGLVAAILSDYFAIAVRNECFCAHPYVREMLKQELWETELEGIAPEDQERYINLKRGMVRASFGLYNTREDIDSLIAALQDIHGRIDEFAQHYEPRDDGSYCHKTFAPDWRNFFDPEQVATS
jgi:cysteine desulfurase/selenocysteine lyase